MAAPIPFEWVVYRMKQRGNQPTHNAVCSQTEWDAMELADPGHHTLIRDHIMNEGEAERLARDLQTPPPVPKPARPSFAASRRAAEQQPLPTVTTNT